MGGTMIETNSIDKLTNQFLKDNNAYDGLSLDRGRYDSKEDNARVIEGKFITRILLDNEDQLSDKQKFVVYAYYRRNKNQKTIARFLKISQQAVNERLKSARKMVGV